MSWAYCEFENTNISSIFSPVLFIIPFSGFTRQVILPQYGRSINNWPRIKKLSKEKKQSEGLFSVMEYRGEDINIEFQKLVKYLDQWYFMAKTVSLVGTVYERPTILKKAKGKFVPWSEADEWYVCDIFTI